MPRGVPHSPELRAQAVAAVLAGTTIAQVAAQFKLNKGLVSRWVATTAPVATVATRQRARDPDTVAELLYDLVADHVQALRVQLQAASRAEWLEKQSAADLAELVVAERDTLIRVLAGFRPVDSDNTTPGLPEPADAASGAAADGG
jgi:transposase-like protein